MTGRRGLVLTVVLLAMAGVLLLLTDNRPLGLVALAGIAGVLATSGALRRVVGAVLAAIGGLAGLAVLTDSLAPTAGAQRGLAIAAVTAVVVAGALVMLHGGRWSDSSRRNQWDIAGDQGASTESSSLELWRALDRGEDPTETRGDDAGARPGTRDVDDSAGPGG